MTNKELVRNVTNFIDLNLLSNIDLNDLLSVSNYGISQFYKIFSDVTGQTPKEYIRNKRLSLSCYDLLFSNLTILDIAIKYMNSSQEAYTRAFSRLFDISPGKFRKKNATIDRGIGGTNIDMTNPNKQILKNVCRVGFQVMDNRTPENIPFPSCLASVMRYLGEDYPWIPVVEHNMSFKSNYAYTHFLGVTGMAFSLLWRDGWHLDNVEHLFIANPLDIINIAFQSCGYNYRVIEKKNNKENEQYFKDEIIKSINKGVPVLAIGVIGNKDCCVITGYDHEGEVLIGWSYYQDDPKYNQNVDFTEEGYFYKTNWYKDTWSIIIIENKMEINKSLMLNNTISWIIKVMETKTIYGRNSGINAIEAWEKHLNDESAFIDSNYDTLERMFLSHILATLQLAESRYYGSLFLKRLASQNTKYESELMEASSLCKIIHDLVYKIWDICDIEISENNIKLFKTSEVRRRLSKIINEVKELDIRILKIFKCIIT